MGAEPSIIDILETLTPCELPGLDRVRIGGERGDGGYVMIDRFAPGQAVYSYGLGEEVGFDLALAEKGLDLFMYDHTVAGVPSAHPRFRVVREGIAATDRTDAPLATLATHLARNGHGERTDLILKLDIENAEWEVLGGLDEAVLGRFEQIVLELHNIRHYARGPLRATAYAVLDRLRTRFHLHHVHSNNVIPLGVIDGMVVPDTLELSYLRKDLGVAAPWRGFLPSELDRPNDPAAEDHVLAFYPFLPCGLAPDEYAAGMRAAHRRAWRSLRERLEAIAPPIPTRGRNIAPDGRCAQSSLSAWSRGPGEADAATRTERDGTFAFHTAFQRDPWWAIDFGGVRRFDEILCFNRLDGESARADRLIVETSDDGRSWRTLFKNREPFGGIDGKPLRVACAGTRARIVRLRLPGETALHLDGVEIRDWSKEP